MKNNMARACAFVAAKSHVFECSARAQLSLPVRTQLLRPINLKKLCKSAGGLFHYAAICAL
jgi:hypothetical protein